MVLAVFVVGYSPRRCSCRGGSAWVFPIAVLAVFAATAGFAWERMVDAPENAVLAGGLEPAGSTSASGRRASHEGLPRVAGCPASA